jgi:hypothetical protein
MEQHPTVRGIAGSFRTGQVVRRKTMADRLKKEEFVHLLATQMNTDEATATVWVDGIVESLYESFKAQGSRQ